LTEILLNKKKLHKKSITFQEQYTSELSVERLVMGDVFS